MKTSQKLSNTLEYASHALEKFMTPQKMTSLEALKKIERLFKKIQQLDALISTEGFVAVKKIEIYEFTEELKKIEDYIRWQV